MVRGSNSKKNDVLHDHMHLESENQSSAPVARAAILFNAKNRHFPCISQRVIPAHFFRYGLKYSFQVRNFGGHNLVTGLRQFTQLWGFRINEFQNHAFNFVFLNYDGDDKFHTDFCS